MKAILGLGTNQWEREKNLMDAIEAISLLPNTSVRLKSSIYQTKPYGFQNQPDFLNMVIEIETTFSPHALLGACLGIEAGMGRKRIFKNGPRIIDIDLLLYEDFAEFSDELTVPHPEILNRSFVLVPLKELYPTGETLKFSFLDAYLKHPKDDYSLFNQE